MTVTQIQRAERFAALHRRDGAFVMPNPTNPGTARILADLGFEALATSSSGFAHSLGRPDAVRAVSREEALAHVSAIAAATDLPVNADLEGGFGDEPTDVVETVLGAAAAGAVGCSIEDATGDASSPIYDFDLAVERIAAGMEAVRTLDAPFVLTARAENHLYGSDDLADTIRRLQAFDEAGADVLYAPGLPDIESVRLVVGSVGKPVNALAGLYGAAADVAALAAVGVTRISIGGWLARVADSAFYEAARDLAENGRFGFASMPSVIDLNEAFTAWIGRDWGTPDN